MPTSEWPDAKEKAAEISRQIQNSRPLKKDRDDPASAVTGGFNQKNRPQSTEDEARKDLDALEQQGR